MQARAQRMGVVEKLFRVLALSASRAPLCRMRLLYALQTHVVSLLELCPHAIPTQRGKQTREKTHNNTLHLAVSHAAVCGGEPVAHLASRQRLQIAAHANRSQHNTTRQRHARQARACKEEHRAVE